VRLDVRAFFRALREHVGGPLPYMWVPEWHQRHGLHIHFGVNRFIRPRAIRDTWGHGHVDIRLLSDLPIGLTGLQEARVAGAYLAKYIGKSFSERAVKGLHRYEVAQGFQPPVLPFTGTTAEGCLAQASAHMGAEPSSLWRSEDAPGWQGPPAVWAAWNG
jgi:hypothetical protein